MADFLIAYNKTSQFEGGYVNHKSDKGGETYAGIARKFHPNWSGWLILDTIDKSNKTNRQIDQYIKSLSNYELIKSLVFEFYLINFWEPILGDQIINQEVANNIYDWAVNSGVNRAVKETQKIIKVVADGDFGPKTLKSLNDYDPKQFVEAYKSRRSEFVKSIAESDNSQKVFLTGWLNRIKLA